jgi:hypothetical protein
MRFIWWAVSSLIYNLTRATGDIGGVGLALTGIAAAINLEECDAFSTV